MELQILENLKTSPTYRSVYDDKVVLICKSHARFRPALVSELELDDGDEIVFAKSQQTSNWYFAIIPITSKISGYRVYIEKGSRGVLKVNARSIVKRGLPRGVYRVGDPTYNSKTGIEWFPLFKISE
jgi:hypothetical protein